MAVAEKGTNTEVNQKMTSHGICCGLTLKDILKITSQFLVPLLLAIFTIVVTYDQRNENRIQRLEDRRLSEEQREQDLNISRQQRIEDRELAKEQRELDLNISREQRENDRWIAEEQRKYDKQIASDKRLADDLNADIQRNMTRDQRLYEINIEQERYKKDHEKYLDNLLLSYYNEMGDLFQKTNGTSLSFYPISFSLARAKTLNVIQQIGPIRSTHLIMFLYGAGQLTIQNKSIDLSQAYLNYIDLRSQRTLINIYLAGAYLNNASFVGQNISYANFQGAQLNGADFGGAICIGTIFDDAHLVKADFTGADISRASFIKTNLQGAIFHKTNGQSPLFRYARMQKTNFSDCHFNFQLVDRKGFIDSNLAASNFHRANLGRSRFIYCNLTQADFTDADLPTANMTGSIMSYASFFNTDLGLAVLYFTNFSYANLTTIRCSGTYYNVSGCKLNQPLTLENAQMPNKSFGLPLTPVFTVKDHPHCLRYVLGETFPFVNDSQWKIEPSNSVYNQYRFLQENYVKRNACVLTPRKTEEIISMTRNIDLTNYSALIKEGRARAVIYCFVGYSTRISITQLRRNERKLVPDDWFAFKWTELLGSATASLQITVEFFEPMNEIYSWFHDLQLYIYADIRAPDTYLMHSKQT